MFAKMPFRVPVLSTARFKKGRTPQEHQETSFHLPQEDQSFLPLASTCQGTQACIQTNQISVHLLLRHVNTITPESEPYASQLKCCWTGSLESHMVTKIQQIQTRIPAFLKFSFPYPLTTLSNPMSFPKTNVCIPVTSLPISSEQSPTWIPVDKRSTSCHRSPRLGVRWTNSNASSCWTVVHRHAAMRGTKHGQKVPNWSPAIGYIVQLQKWKKCSKNISCLNNRRFPTATCNHPLWVLLGFPCNILDA